MTPAWAYVAGLLTLPGLVALAALWDSAYPEGVVRVTRAEGPRYLGGGPRLWRIAGDGRVMYVDVFVADPWRLGLMVRIGEMGKDFVGGEGAWLAVGLSLSRIGAVALARRTDGAVVVAWRARGRAQGHRRLWGPK